MKFPRRLFILASILCVASASGFILMQKQLDRERMPHERMKEKLIYIPDAKIVKTASLGFHAALADIMWVRAIVYFGGHYLTDKDYTWLYHLLDVTTSLDPKNLLAFRFGGSLLALEQNDVDRSIALLKKGIQENPDADWRLYFLLGFNYFYFLEDHATAAKYLEKASRIPGHPDYLPRLAAKMYARSEKLDTAIDFLKEMYEQNGDENAKSAILGRLNILFAKRQAQSLRSIIEKYKKVYGEYPDELEDIVHAGLIEELPQYNDGDYVYDSDTGEVDWVSESDSHWP